MTTLNKQDNLLEAIDSYPLLTKNPKKILKALSIFDEAVPAESIISASSLVKQVVYPSLSKLINKGLVIKTKPQNSSCYLFEVNKTRLFELLELYTKTKAIKHQIQHENKENF